MVKASKNKKTKYKKIFKGFTIIELAIVIVIIGILTTVSIMAYGNWQKNIKETQIKSDLTGAKTAMENWRSFHGSYPTSIGITDFKSNSGTEITGGSSDGETFSLSGSKDGVVYSISNGTEPVLVPNLAIGDSYGGGKVGYLFKSGDSGYDPGQQHGLIVSNVDQAGGVQWARSAYYNDYSAQTNTIIGSGLTNTNNIINQNGPGNDYAAGIARAYTITVNGVTYNNWYLPSKEELYEIQTNIHIGSSYWSSSQKNPNGVYVVSFIGSIPGLPPVTEGFQPKNSIANVRAVRSF